MAEINGKTIETERNFTFSEAEYNQLMEEQRKERMKALRRHKLPEKLSLQDALLALTKQELEDIQYNLNLPMGNLNRTKKADMVAAIEPEVVNFVGRWFVSAFQEQKDIFDYACQHKGLLKDLQQEDYRLDYLRGVGVLYCGLQDGEMLWYMPEEIQAEYEKINNAAYADAVNLNTEVMRLAAGMVYYYGIIDYDQLYQKVCDQIDGELDFADFMGIIFNGGCWYPQVVTTEKDLMHESVMNPEALQAAQRQRGMVNYADFPYDKLFDAGQESYIESTEAYRALAQYFMKQKQLDVLQAAEAVNSINMILQNGYGMKEIMGFLKDHELVMESRAEADKLVALIGDYNNTLPQWVLKGYTPEEAANMPRQSVVRTGRKIGRNEPCPCGSGKKYKNCCLKKEY